MRKKGFLMLAVLISFFLWINGASAENKGYIDSRQNYLTGRGVVGAEYTGTDYNGSAIVGWASQHSGNIYGGSFQSNSTSGTAVYGLAAGNSGTTYGGVFSSWSPSGTGVRGNGFTYGGYFQADGTSGTGVRGYASATTGYTYAGHFWNKSTSGTGVYGYASATSGNTAGGVFASQSTNGKAVLGWATAGSGTTYGGFFQNSSTGGTGVWGYAAAPSGYTYGGNFQSQSNNGKGVMGYASSTSGTNYGVYGKTNSPSGYGVYSKGNMKVEGKFIATGTKAAAVKLKNGESVSLYAVEASENWFEDFGSSKLKEGSALVKIDPTFAETVNTEMEYHVFLTPKGDCKGLYVTNETGTSFEVRELNRGKSNIPFSYRIVAKRKGYEDQRLAKVDDDETTVMVTTQRETMQKDDAIKLVSHVK